MHQLGRLEDLPQDYRDALSELNLVPLWPSLRSLLPPDQPALRTRPVCWPYQSLRPLLLQAGQLTPMEKAERRVLVLANPGHGLEKMQASSTIYLGMQLLLPGETAPSHRHTPNAVRMMVEGSGAYTTVDGEKCAMERGDLILTPSGMWHEHGHEGSEPVVWLDVLDLPLLYYMEASYVMNAGPKVEPGLDRSPSYLRGGVLPTPMFERRRSEYPLLRYPWKEVRAALLALAANQPESLPVQVAYVNPETGADCQRILGYSALMLRPGQTLRLPARSASCVLHVIEGAAKVRVGQEQFSLAAADTCCAPGYGAITIENLAGGQPSFLFLADDAPFQKKLGVYEVRE